MNIHKTEFILASQSPRRSKLLAQIGIIFETHTSNFIEDLSIILKMPKFTFIKALFY